MKDFYYENGVVKSVMTSKRISLEATHKAFLATICLMCLLFIAWVLLFQNTLPPEYIETQQRFNLAEVPHMVTTPDGKFINANGEEMEVE